MMINDDELVQIFIEESQDILESVNKHFEHWQKNLHFEALNTILRELHTLKGSSRMVGLAKLSDYLHVMEQIIEKINQEKIPPSDNLAKEIQHSLDFLNIYVDALSKSKPLTEEEIPLAELSSLIQTVPMESPDNPGLFKQEVIDENIISSQAGTSEVIRVKAELLEKFGKLSGQINISRSHLEQQLKSIFDYLTETTKEIKLTQEQMRYLQVKADANLRMYQSDISQKSYEEFDILEMDRYSFLQNLSRQLIDKLDKIEGLNTYVINYVRSAESLINEQGRVARALEDGITHTRMISIDQVVPRLKLIVRQVGHELSKEVHLECIRAQGDMDRKVLEKLISPLEHMIRNAVDHGIEAPEMRKKAGKPEYGVILLSLFRHGNEIVIQLADDGQGIDIDSVRKKAIEKNLWPAHLPMSIVDASQIICFPGFSTRKSITAISGRGVGMDVVTAHVKKLGGTLHIESQKGAGTQFTIRVPFTLSLNQALILISGKNHYAIVLSNLSGITRISTPHLLETMKSKKPNISYAEESYSLFYLAELLGEAKWEGSSTEANAFPILFLQSESSRVALIIDRLVGSREILIKPAGIQLQFLREISGVTLLGNGQIVLILDAQFLIQRALGNVEENNGEDRLIFRTTKKALSKVKVLIVDDSTTVRQVTSRLLKKHQFEVFTAPDGEEAFEVMAHDLPDIILLDIEMPKMDGFEVVKKMRSDPKYKDIPVIMITSRAGDKHRLRAMSLGANAYMIKPYREEELLVLLRKYQNHQLT